MSAMDIFVFPSLYEGLGLVLIEAQANGLKCFTSKNVVPLEAKVSNSLEYIELNKSPQYWASEILKVNSSRTDNYKEIINKGYDPLSYKLFTYSSHYRNKLNFTWDAIEGASKSLERLKNGYKMHKEGKEEVEEEIIKEYEERFHKAINDDLNMPLSMGVVWEVVRNEKKSPKFAELLLKFDEVLGLKIDEEIKKDEEKEEIPEEILKLVEERNKARKNKDWAKSDELRDILQEKGYKVIDSKNGTKIEK